MSERIDLKYTVDGSRMMPDATYRPTDRRPIGARGWRLSQRTTSWLVRRGVSPNSISFAGMVCGIAAGIVLAATTIIPPNWERVLWLLVAVLILFRLIANMLDGMVAIESGCASRLGELFNEVPDRVSDAAILIGLGYARESEPVLGYVAALLAIFTAYVRTVGKVAGTPQFYQGPMAKQHRMWLIIVFCLWAAAAPDTLAVRYLDGGLTMPSLVLTVIVLGCIITSVRRLILIRDALRE